MDGAPLHAHERRAIHSIAVKLPGCPVVRLGVGRDGARLQPILKTCFAKSGAGARDQAVVVQDRAEIASVGISNYLTMVVIRLERLPDEVVEAELLRPADLDDAVERRAFSDRHSAAATSAAAIG